jgi:dTDP-4-amino-4,6-dideoxygalactose transaminase
MKSSLDGLAIFGGRPIFSSPRPIGQLAAPDIDDYLGLLKEAFAARRLTNDGAILLRLERRLAAFHETRHCIAVANAGLGLTMLLQLLADGRRGEVIIPAFSYRGLPHFVRWAGHLPRFCDVEVATHGLDPDAVGAAVNDNTVAILAVCNCNSPGDIDALCRLAEARGLPIVFDSVYALGATYRGRRLGGFGHAEVYSLHATKLINGFEGGYITTDDGNLAEKLRWQRNFCLPGLRPACTSDDDCVLGLNAKLNEMHAAMALLGLARFEQIVAGNYRRFRAYQVMCAGLPGVCLLPPQDGEGEQRNYGLAVAEIGKPWRLSRDQTVALMRAEGMVIAPYYSPPLHRSQPMSAGLPIPALPVAEALAERFLQLPVGELVSLADVAKIGDLLGFVQANGDAVAARLAAMAVG